MLQAIGLHPRIASFGEELHRFHHDLGALTHRHGEDDHFRYTAREATDALRRAYTDAVRYDGRTVVVKISTLSLQVDYVKALFPEARFIQCVRDGRDTVCSMEDLRLALQREQAHPRLLGPAPDPLSLWAAEHFEHPHLRAGCSWFYHVTRSFLDLQFAGTPSFMRLRYEDLLADPRGVLGRVMDFIGTGFAAEQQRAVTATTDAPGADSLGFSTSQASGPRKARYTRDMQPEVRTLLAPLLAKPMALMGYAPDDWSEAELAASAKALGMDATAWLERVERENAWFALQQRVFDPVKMLREADAPSATARPMLIDGATFGSHADRRDGTTSVPHAWVQKQDRRYAFADELMLWPAIAAKLDGTNALADLVPVEHLAAATKVCGRLHALGLLGYA